MTVAEQTLLLALQQNTEAMQRVAAAVEENGRKNEMLERGMMRMVGTIQGAQKKIAGEIGPAIEQSKRDVRAQNEELARIRAAGGRADARG